MTIGALCYKVKYADDVTHMQNITWVNILFSTFCLVLFLNMVPLRYPRSTRGTNYSTSNLSTMKGLCDICDRISCGPWLDQITIRKLWKKILAISFFQTQFVAICSNWLTATSPTCVQMERGKSLTNFHSMLPQLKFIQLKSTPNRVTTTSFISDTLSSTPYLRKKGQKYWPVDTTVKSQHTPEIVSNTLHYFPNPLATPLEIRLSMSLRHKFLEFLRSKI